MEYISSPCNWGCCSITVIENAWILQKDGVFHVLHIEGCGSLKAY